jgi:hypothetical protein
MVCRLFVLQALGQAARFLLQQLRQEDMVLLRLDLSTLLVEEPHLRQREPQQAVTRLGMGLCFHQQRAHRAAVETWAVLGVQVGGLLLELMVVVEQVAERAPRQVEREARVVLDIWQS